jgi:hypothetical protein
MRMNRFKMAAAPVVMLGVLSPMLINCGALSMIPGADCKAMETGDFSQLKADANVKGFLEAAFTFDKLVLEMETGLIAACGELGKSLGMADAELAAEPDGGKGGEKVCGAVSAKLDAFMKANASAQLSVEIGAPKCYADIETLNACFGTCGSPVSPGEMKRACEGGELSGECSGKCEGSCQIEAGAECSGTCSGSCSGACTADFSGTCGGKCEGKCDGKDSKGAACAGKCEGKCDAKAEGKCGGECKGTCSASCEAKAAGECKGSCSGSCDVEMKAPKCSGEFKPPSVSIDCQAQCTAKAMAKFSCDPPSVKVVAKGEANADIEKVIAGLEVALPKIVEIGVGKGKAVAMAGAGLVTQIQGAASGAASGGLEVVGCMTAAVGASVSAAASVDVNISASASVSGSASGSTGG